MIKLFLAKPYPFADVVLEWGDKTITTKANEDGFFRLEWNPRIPLQCGWNGLTVKTVIDGEETKGTGKLLVPETSQYVYISDIDDTFLISHSSNIFKRLYELVTKNAQTRKPFKDVVAHYQLLAKGKSEHDTPNPFFYVSSSEWNLYEYIKEFCRTHHLPEGVFLLSELKRWYELTQTGQGKHETKYDRIARILRTFPHRQYVLLGDDTQKDPDIYLKVATEYPESIKCVYLRMVNKSNRKKTNSIVSQLEQLNIDTCYYKHSNEAIEHSRSAGLF